MLQPRNRSIQSEIKRKIEELEQQEMDEKNNLKNLKTIGRTRLQVPAELRTGTCHGRFVNRIEVLCEGHGWRAQLSKVGQFLALSAIDISFLSGLCCDYVQILRVFVWPDSVFLHVCVCVTVSKLYPEIRQIENLTLGQDITRLYI